jgi:hypothetical protein
LTHGVDERFGHIDYFAVLIAADGSEVDEVGTNAQRERTSREIVGCVAQIDSAGRNKTGFREWRLEGLDVLRASGAAAWENLDDLRPSFQGSHDFRGGERTGDRQNSTSGGRLQDWNRQTGADEELRASIEADLCLFGSGDSTRTGQNARAILPGKFLNHRRGVGHGHCNFDDRYAAGADCVYGTTRFVEVSGANDWNDADFLNFAYSVLNIHGGAPGFAVEQTELNLFSGEQKQMSRRSLCGAL